MTTIEAKVQSVYAYDHLLQSVLDPGKPTVNPSLLFHFLWIYHCIYIYFYQYLIYYISVITCWWLNLVLSTLGTITLCKIRLSKFFYNSVIDVDLKIPGLEQV